MPDRGTPTSPPTLQSKRSRQHMWPVATARGTPFRCGCVGQAPVYRIKVAHEAGNGGWSACWPRS